MPKTLISNPKVICLCCTYGRPVLLGEAIKSFIDQNYSNKELIVLNDQEGVRIHLDKDYDGVEIVNYPTRFKSLGQKRNYIKNLFDSDYYCLWEDDDLSTPWRLEESVKYMEANSDLDCVKTRISLTSTDNTKYQICGNNFEGSTCYRGDFLSEQTYNANESVTMDIHLENIAKSKGIDVTPLFWYIYRWGLNTHHLSGISDEKETWKKSLTFKQFTDIKGDIVIEPKYTRNHWEDVAKFMDTIGQRKEWEEKIKKSLDNDQ